MPGKGKRKVYSDKPGRPSYPRAKKHLGQHFLTDENIARRIAGTLSLQGYDKVLEIGPGSGVLTRHLLERGICLTAMEFDREAVQFLQQRFIPDNSDLAGDPRTFNLVQADALSYDLHALFGSDQFAITGNFPYNISTQIVFRALEMKAQVPEFTGMFQLEVARRICEKEGSKSYGILSVLVQAFYEATFLFSVPPEVFVPPPKVQSGVIRLRRRSTLELGCDEALFFKVVKTAFNQRRKTLRNSLKSLGLSDNLKEDTIFDRRPEQLGVAQFIALTRKIAHDTV